MIAEACIIGGCIIFAAFLVAGPLAMIEKRLLQIMRVIEEWQR